MLLRTVWAHTYLKVPSSFQTGEVFSYDPVPHTTPPQPHPNPNPCDEWWIDWFIEGLIAPSTAQGNLRVRQYHFDVNNGLLVFQTLAPVRLRAEAMRSHFGDVEVMRSKLDLKDEEIKEVKRLIKIKVCTVSTKMKPRRKINETKNGKCDVYKSTFSLQYCVWNITAIWTSCISIVCFTLVFQQEELSEQQVRVGLIEKKLENANKDADDRVDKIQRKLDEANMQFKKKEKYVQTVAVFPTEHFIINFNDVIMA